MSVPINTPVVHDELLFAQRFSDEARDLYCQRFGCTPAEADERLAAEGAVLRSQWAAFSTDHPTASLHEFLADQLVAAICEIGNELRPDLSPARREQVARAIASEGLRRFGRSR